MAVESASGTSASAAASMSVTGVHACKACGGFVEDQYDRAVCMMCGREVQGFRPNVEPYVSPLAGWLVRAADGTVMERKRCVHCRAEFLHPLNRPGRPPEACSRRCSDLANNRKQKEKKWSLGAQPVPATRSTVHP